MKKQMKSLLCLALALLLVCLSACASKPEQAPEPAPASVPDAAPESAPESAPEPEVETVEITDDDMTAVLDIPFDEGSVYMNSGMKLTVPSEYASLVLVSQGNPAFEADDMFTVRELASVEAGEKIHPGEDWGDGVLVGIGRISEKEVHMMLCGYLNNERPFARDANGDYYVAFYPSDVRLMREDMENLIGTPDLEQWSALNDWAATVPETFIENNPGLEPWNPGSSEIDMYLARIAYAADQTDYTFIHDFQEMPHGSVDAVYAEKLLLDADFNQCSNYDTPEGEYDVLYFPKDEIRLYFYKGGDYVAIDYGDYQALYRITAPADGYCRNALADWAEALEG